MKCQIDGEYSLHKWKTICTCSYPLKWFILSGEGTLTQNFKKEGWQPYFIPFSINLWHSSSNTIELNLLIPSSYTESAWEWLVCPSHIVFASLLPTKAGSSGEPYKIVSTGEMWLQYRCSPEETSDKLPGKSRVSTQLNCTKVLPKAEVSLQRARVAPESRWKQQWRKWQWGTYVPVVPWTCW